MWKPGLEAVRKDNRTNFIMILMATQLCHLSCHLISNSNTLPYLSSVVFFIVVVITNLIRSQGYDDSLSAQTQSDTWSTYNYVVNTKNNISIFRHD